MSCIGRVSSVIMLWMKHKLDNKEINVKHKNPRVMRKEKNTCHYSQSN